MIDIVQVEKEFKEYSEQIIKKNAKKLVEYLYPGFFKISNKESVLESLKDSYSSKVVFKSFSDFKIVSYSIPTSKSDMDYAIIETSNVQELKFVEKFFPKNENPYEDSRYLKEIHEPEDIQFDDENKTITINVSNLVLVICENENFYFLDIQDHYVEHYKAFLPENVIEHINKILASEETEDAVNFTTSNTPVNQPTDLNKSEYDKVIYVAGNEVLLDNSKEGIEILKAQAIDKDLFQYQFMALELLFKDDKLSEINNFFDGEKETYKPESTDPTFTYQNIEPNNIFSFDTINEGENYLGGDFPEELTLPEGNFKTGFTYIGKFSNKDEHLKWLPFDLHLFHPILSSIQLFIDYSNPLYPQIINKAELEETSPDIEGINQDSKIIFEKTSFKLEETKHMEPDLNAGIPSWVQYPEIPECPKSGKTMKFLCQIEKGPKTIETNINFKDDYYNNYIEHMNFISDGYLCVFFQPESKVACLFTQCT